MTRKIGNIVIAGVISCMLLSSQSCNKKPDTPKMELIKYEAPNGDSNINANGFPKITLTVKNTGDMNAYNVACGVVATRHKALLSTDSVVSSDTATFTQTYIAPGVIDTAQAWFFNLKNYKQFDHVTYILYWWDVNSKVYSKIY